VILEVKFGSFLMQRVHEYADFKYDAAAMYLQYLLLPDVRPILVLL
jgi:hypothetical protein